MNLPRFWPWISRARAATESGWLQIKLAEAEARLQACQEQRDNLRGRLEAERKAAEALVDNALFAAGMTPIFNPGAPRFQPRPAAQQQAESQRRQRPLTAAEWRQRLENGDRQAAERDRRARWSEELQRIVQERQQQKSGMNL